MGLDIQIGTRRISKFILPYLSGRVFQSKLSLLSELERNPVDFENYVLKPYFPSQNRVCFFM